MYDGANGRSKLFGVQVLPARKLARGMRGGAKLAGHVVFAVLSALLSPELVPTPGGLKCFERPAPPVSL